MEILHTYTQAMDFTGAVIPLTLVALIIGVLSWAYFDENKRIRGTICGIASASFAMIVISVGISYFSGDLDETYHEVKITDMSAFDTDRYEIVKQRGTIFVIKEVAK